MAKQLEVKVPDIGDFKDVPVIEVLVAEGDEVNKDAPLITLESDKATMEVPAPAAGTVRNLKLKEGDKVSEGSLVLLLETADGGETDATAAEPDQRQPAAGPSAPTPQQPAAASAEKPAAPKAAATGGGGSVEVKVPDIGDFEDVPVIEVLVAEGDEVNKDAPLITLESDKATMEVPTPAAGTVRNLKLKEGDKVSEGASICTIESAGESASESADGAAADNGSAASAAARRAPQSGATPEAASRAPAPPPPASDQQAAPPHASPSVRKFARELGVDLTRIPGSGPHGRILQEDVQNHVKQALGKPQAAIAGGTGAGIPPIPQVDFSAFGEVESKPLARIRKLSAAHLHRCWLNVPHVTQTDEADITELEAFRHAQNAKRGIKLTLLPFIIKAVATAIDAYPEFAASLDASGENLIMKRYRHIGFAADTPNGLMVPVVRDVERKGIEQLARETGELAGKARDGKLKPDEMKGGVFSISSLGGIGGSHFTPIVNAPEVGILGVSRAVMKPVWDGERFQPRLMCPLSLSYDHRVIDGAYAARFIVHLVSLLSDLRRLIL